VFPARRIAVLILVTTISAVGGDSPSSWGELVGNPELDKWIEVALAEAPSLDVLRGELRVAAAGSRTARAAGRPTLDARIDLREGRRRTPLTGNESQDLDLLSAGVDAVWELDVFGRIRSSVGAAEFAELAGEYMIHDRALSLAAEVAQRYLEGCCRAEEVAIREAAVSANEAISDYLAGRVAAGLERPEVREQADAARLLAERRAAEAREVLDMVEARWRYLVPDDAMSGIVPPRCALPGQLPELPDAEALHAYALNRPDVQAAHALWRGAEESTQAEARDRMPTLEAIATAEGDGPSPTEEPDEWVAWAGIRLSLPVLAPRIGAEQESRHAEEDVQSAHYNESVRLALLDIRERYVERIHAEQRWKAALEESTQLKASFESAERQFEQGLEPVTVPERARLRWLEADERRVRLHALTLRRHIALLRACGGVGLASSSAISQAR